jgi:hypothetical protein
MHAGRTQPHLLKADRRLLSETRLPRFNCVDGKACHLGHVSRPSSASPSRPWAEK